MTAESPEIPVTEGARSLEVRWIFPGQLEAAVARWFRAVPGQDGVTRGHLPARAAAGWAVGEGPRGGALEVKAYRGSPGILELAGRASGRLESWQKWSFPVSPLSPGSGNPAGGGRSARDGASAGSHRAAGRSLRVPRGHSQEPGCEVELTEVHTSGQDWWSLGFEATGPRDLLRSELEATAALVFAEALPGGVEAWPGSIQVLCRVARPAAGHRE